MNYGGPAVLVAEGPAHHSYATGGATCEADVRIVAQYDVVVRRLTVLSDSPCILPLPYFSQVSSCRSDAEGNIACLREAPGVLVSANLRADGAFNLTWVEPDFVEYIEGTLTRASART